MAGCSELPAFLPTYGRFFGRLVECQLVPGSSICSSAAIHRRSRGRRGSRSARSPTTASTVPTAAGRSPPRTTSHCSSTRVAPLARRRAASSPGTTSATSCGGSSRRPGASATSSTGADCPCTTSTSSRRRSRPRWSSGVPPPSPTPSRCRAADELAEGQRGRGSVADAHDRLTCWRHRITRTLHA